MLMEKTEENNLHSCIIGGKEFNIKISGKTVCAIALLPTSKGISFVRGGPLQDYCPVL
jgi:hypothetical protein